jgi:FMN hydrolase / 5-amino-6-(5-phospho-D-ribitylamino)uracil phosphatase
MCQYHVQKNTIRAITLDLDDTLWPVGPTIARADRRAHEWLAERAPAVAAAWPTERLRELRAAIHDARPDLRHDLLQIRRLSLEQAFEDCGFERRAVAHTVSGALEVFMGARNEVELYPEVAACLQRLARRYPIASLSNGNADLSRIGLDHLFRARVAAHAHGASKPDAVLFHIACRELGCHPHEVVHVGDDAELDVRGARGAGLHAVWINRGGHAWPGSDHPVTVPDLDAFERWLQEA